MHMLLFMVVVGCASFVMSCLGKCSGGNNDPVLTHEWGYTVINQPKDTVFQGLRCI